MENEIIEEVNVYMAYGLVSQAEEVLLVAIKQNSNYAKYAAKLIEVYFTTKNTFKFQIAVETFRTVYGTDDPHWRGIEDWQKVLNRSEKNKKNIRDEDFDFLDDTLDPAFAFDESDLEPSGDFSEIMEEFDASSMVSQPEPESPDEEFEQTIEIEKHDFNLLQFVQNLELSDEIVNRVSEVPAHPINLEEVHSIEKNLNAVGKTDPIQVFLCHASEDKEIVRVLYTRLVKSGFSPWLDEENLLPGQDWNAEITKQVKRSDVVLVCLSKNSEKRGYVQKEIKQALDIADEQPQDAIYLIPVKIEECHIPERLNRWHFVEFFRDSGYKKLELALWNVEKFRQ